MRTMRDFPRGGGFRVKIDLVECREKYIINDPRGGGNLKNLITRALIAPSQ